MTGDMPTPNDTLKVEWFYMSFHQEDRARYLESGRCLCNETPEIITEYFDNIFNLQVANGLLTKKHEKKPNANSTTKWRSATTTRFATLQISTTSTTIVAMSVNICILETTTRNTFVATTTIIAVTIITTSVTTETARVSPSTKSQHNFEKCFKNRKNQDKKSHSYDKKCACKVHHNNERHVSKDRESRASVVLPAPSDSLASPSEDEQQDKDEQYHVHFEKKMKVGSQVAHCLARRKALSQL